MTTEEKLQGGYGHLTQISLATFNVGLEDLLSRRSVHGQTLDFFAELFEHESLYSISPDLVLDDEPIARGSGPSRKRKPLLTHLALSICKYLQNDPELRKKIDSAMDEVQSSESSKIAGKAALSGIAVVSLANYICSNIPGMDSVGTAGLTGIILIFLNVGSDAFCNWVRER